MAAVGKELTCLKLLSLLILSISVPIIQALDTEDEDASTEVYAPTNAESADTHLTNETPKAAEPTKSLPSINGTEYAKQEQASEKANNDVEADTGKIAGIIIGVLGGVAIITTVVAFLVYKQYLRRNVTSMNFDNPVYRKTTEDQFSLEKNQYQPARSYPPGLEPLTSPGTNEFV